MQQNQQLLEEIIDLWSLVSNSKNELQKLYSRFNETEERLKKIIKQNMILSPDDEKENLYIKTDKKSEIDKPKQQIKFITKPFEILAVGMKFINNYDFSKFDSKNDSLSFELEPTNRFDTKAVKILINNTHQAYICKKNNSLIYDILNHSHFIHKQEYEPKIITIKPGSTVIKIKLKTPVDEL